MTSPDAGLDGPPRRGRPRGFDEAVVRRAAQDVFWRYGVEQTSLAQLTEATGLHKPSIYAAYGDKRGLFLATLEDYRATAAALVARALGEAVLRDAVAAFLTADLALFGVDDRGCYVLCIAGPAGRRDAAIRAVARDAMSGLTEALRGRIAAASDRELPPGMSRALLLDLIIATHVALAVATRDGARPDELTAQVARFTAQFPR